MLWGSPWFRNETHVSVDPCERCGFQRVVGVCCALPSTLCGSHGCFVGGAWRRSARLQ